MGGAEGRKQHRKRDLRALRHHRRGARAAPGLPADQKAPLVEALRLKKKGSPTGCAKLAEKSKIIFPYGTDLLRSKQIKPQQILSQSLLGLNYIY